MVLAQERVFVALSRKAAWVVSIKSIWDLLWPANPDSSLNKQYKQILLGIKGFLQDLCD